jgi:hypothetical protein
MLTRVMAKLQIQNRVRPGASARRGMSLVERRTQRRRARRAGSDATIGRRIWTKAEPTGDTGSMGMPKAVGDPLGIDPLAILAFNALRVHRSERPSRPPGGRERMTWPHRAGERRVDPS